MKEKIMYNREIKQAFFDSPEATPRSRVYLEPLTKHEMYLKKDVAEMNGPETAEAIRLCGYLKYSSISIAVGQIKKYKRWYSENVNPLPLSNVNFDWNDVDMSEHYKKCLITSTQEIWQSFSGRRPEEGKLIQPALVLCFHGLSPNDICELKNEDVIFNGNTVIVTNKEKLIRFTDEIGARIIRSYMNARGMCGENKGMFLYRPKAGSGAVDSKILARIISESRRIDLTAEEYESGYMMANSVKLSGELKRVVEAMDRGDDYKKVIIDSGATTVKDRQIAFDQYMAGVKAYRKAFGI